jgi:hypothetical protein
VQRKSLAIATPVGSFKGAFAHGVLTALEEAGIVADAYAAASSSVIPASWAAIGQASNLGIDYWLAGLSALAQRLAPNNFPAVAYASSRIMHAWDIPAWIDGKPYVDAAYTCLCPALAMVAAGYQETIAIANEPGTMYQDMFHIDPVPSYSQGVPIHIIRPDLPLKELGVDFTKATPDGLVAVYRHGKDKGLEFLSKWK